MTDNTNTSTNRPEASGKSNIILTLLLMGISFFAGYLFFKSSALESQISGTTGGQANVQGAQEQAAPPAPREAKVEKPNPSNDNWKGNKDARYVWIEYSDYECPFCQRSHPNLVELMDNNKDIAWVYRHFPLGFHPNAQKLAEASECVAEIGGSEAFWQFNSDIFTSMPDVTLADLPGRVKKFGVDSGKFTSCLDSDKYAKKVTDQMNAASAAGVQATPTGVLFDTKTGKTRVVEGALPPEMLQSELDTFKQETS